MHVSEIHQCPEEVKASITEAGNIVVKCAKKTFNWVDPEQSQKLLNGTGKKDGGIFCFTIGMHRLSMLQCLEIWLIVLSGLSCKPDVLSSASTLTDVMRPRSNMEPGRDKQRFPASQKNESRVIILPAKWETWSHPEINKAESLPLTLQTPVDKTILAGGVFSDATQIESPNPDTDTSYLEASHEADTKAFL